MKAGSHEPPDKPSRPQPDPQGDGKASRSKPGKGDRPKSCGCNAGVLGADSDVGPICIRGLAMGRGSKCHGLAKCPLRACSSDKRLFEDDEFSARTLGYLAAESGLPCADRASLTRMAKFVPIGARGNDLAQRRSQLASDKRNNAISRR